MSALKYTGQPANQIEQRRQEIVQRENSPSTEQIYIRYGQIVSVNPQGLVQVVLLNEKGVPENSPIVNGKFLPINTPLSSILLQWGALRRDLICKVMWKGNVEPNLSTSIDVIGDEEHQLLAKDPFPTEVQVGPWMVFLGGMF